MNKYKAKYSHEKAKEIINEIGAVFVEKKRYDDFYLKIDKGNIFKLQKNENELHLIELNQEDGGFALSMKEYISKDISEILLPLFEKNQFVLRKIKDLYSWKGSKIELDNVEKYGEFIEFYPADEEAKNELFEKFGIREEDLITKSYFNL